MSQKEPFWFGQACRWDPGRASVGDENVPEAGRLLLESWDKDVLAWLMFSRPDRMQTHLKCPF